MHYQLEAERVTNITAISLWRLAPHGVLYLLGPGQWDSYFPFFYAPGGQPFGMARYLPWIWLVPFAFVIRTRGGASAQHERTAITLTLACTFAANLALLACFYGTTARYPGDFANAGLILAGVGALALSESAALGGWAKIANTAVAGAAAISLFFGLAVFAGEIEGSLTGIARIANWPAFTWQRTHGANFGGLHFQIVVKEKPTSPIEQIFETGRTAGRKDRLEIDYLAGSRARLSFVHEGLPPLEGEEFAIPADRGLVIEARCGSLIPPFGFPVFSDWTQSNYSVAKRNLRLTVNGHESLRSVLECYPASPANTILGSAAGSSDSADAAFSGKILNVERIPLLKPPASVTLSGGRNPVELSLLLPAIGHGGADPLVLTGMAPMCDLVYCIYDGLGHIRFALDHHGAGGPQSRTVSYDPLVRHTVTLWMGSMSVTPAPSFREAAASDRLVLIFDGGTLLNIHQAFYPAGSDFAAIGMSAGASSEAGSAYTGEILGVRQVVDGILAPLSGGTTYGSVEMRVEFPRGVRGTQEPLVVSGASGAGDFVYIRYVDAGHVAIGFDHWGIGGALGEPIALDFAQSHDIAISIPSLYPARNDPMRPGSIRVLVDGRVALDERCECYPAGADQIEVGTNPIGGSTCGPNFTGNILRIERHAGSPE
jgi:hypothetical protein